jgi:hypothetical protein
MNDVSTTVKSNIHIESQYDDRDLDFGEYWKFSPVVVEDQKTTLTPNNIYIIVDVKENLITKQVQTVVVYRPKHESGHASQVQFDISEFLDNFTHVPKSDAELIRKKELGLIEVEVKRVSGEMQKALADPQFLLDQIAKSEDEEIAKERSSIHMGIALPSPQMLKARSNQLISDAESLVQADKQKKQLENQVKLGNLATLITRKKSSELSNLLECTTDLMMENAKAITGKATEMNRRVAGIMSKVDMMELYLGKDVEVRIIVEGEGADSNEAYMLFSHMIYLSDEVATERIFASDNFDYSNKEDFFELLKHRPTIVNRIFPSNRCIVMARPTRNSRSYHGEEIGLNEWASRDRANKSALLLVRDGQKISAIISPIDSKQRLYPTDKNMNDFFKAVYADSVNIVDSQRQFERDAQDFNSLSAVLQGVKDRQSLDDGVDIFGGLPKESVGNSFMNSEYVNKNLIFINDEDNLLAQNDLPENLGAWVSQFTQNYNHCKNDLVVYRNNLLNEQAVPSAYRYTERVGEYFTDWEVPYNKSNLKVGRIEVYKGEPLVKISLAKPWDDKEKSFRAFFNRDRVRHHGNVLNLMELPLSIVEKYLKSREHRSALVSNGYMELFVEARIVLMKIHQKAQLILEGLKEHYPSYSQDKRNALLMDWYRNVKPEILEGLTQPKARAIVNKIAATHNQSIAYNDTFIRKMAEKVIKLGDTPIFASIKEGDLYILTDGHKHVGGFGVYMSNVKYPMFGLYQASLSGEITPLGFVGSEVQQYPVTLTLVDKLDSYQLRSNRLDGKSLLKLNKASSEMLDNFVKWIDLTGSAINGSSANKINAIRELFKELGHYQRHAKDIKNRVTLGLPVLPAFVQSNETDSYLTGFDFNFTRAITMIYWSMPLVERLEYESEINSNFSRQLYWEPLDDLKDKNLIGSIISICGEKLTPTFTQTMTITELRVLADGSFKNQRRELKDAKNDALEQMQNIITSRSSYAKNLFN